MIRRYVDIVIIAMVMAIALWIRQAPAHEWYENACCSGQDCAPVPDGTVTETDQGVVVKGWGILAESDQRVRWSQDDRDHLCISKRGPTTYGTLAAQPKLLCVYRKRKFM